MKLWRVLAASLIPVVFLSVLSVRVCLLQENRSPVLVDREAVGSPELPAEDDQSVQTKAESGNLPTSADAQLDTEAKETQTTPKPKPVNSTVELTLLRHTSFDQIPDKVAVECSELEVPNPTPYRNKKHCCLEAANRALTELCGEINASSIRNDSKVEGCTCADLMACKAVVLTATSSNHWLESLDALASVQNVMPDMKIVMMDLGMDADQVEQLQRLRNVEVRTFPFDSFPPHVRSLKVMAWKSLSMQMMLSEYEVVFYMDASIRLRRPLTDILIPAVQKFPIKVNSNGRYDGAFTREETYNYLGVTRKQVSKRRQKEGGLQMYRNCSFLQERILSSLVDCALHEECIAPSGASPSGCDMDKYRQQLDQIDTIEQFEYIGCHRFDQSVMTSVLEREFHFANQHPAVSPAAFRQSLVVWRQATECYTLFLNN